MKPSYQLKFFDANIELGQRCDGLPNSPEGPGTAHSDAARERRIKHHLHVLFGEQDGACPPSMHRVRRRKTGLCSRTP